MQNCWLFLQNFLGKMRSSSAVVALFFSLSAQAAITGYANFGGTTTTAPSGITNLNQDTAYSIRWTSERFDSNYFSHDTSSFNQEITFVTAGSYRLSLSIPLNEVSGNNRRSIRAEVYLNGTPIDIGRAESSYIRDTNNHLTSSLHLSTLLTNISANDVLEVRVSKQTNQAGEVTTPGARLFLQYVDPAVGKVLLLKGDQTTAGTNLNTTSQTDFAWDQRPITNAAFTHSTATNNNQITFAQAGSYRVMLNIPLQDPSACPGNNRTSVKALIKINGAVVPGGEAAQGYIRCADNHQFSSIHWFGFLHGVSAGQTLTVSVIGGTNVTSATVQVPSSRQASLFLEKIEDTSKIISLTGNQLTTGTNWNPTNGGSVSWATEVLKDGAVFSHSTATNNHQITFSESGDYYILYTDILTTGVQRANPTVQLRLNGSLPDGAECSTHYARNSNGHSESSCSMAYLMQNVSAGDVLDVSVTADAQTGTVNDLRDARLTIFQISNQEPILDIGNIPNKVIHFDMSNPQNVLDGSNRNANDLSFAGTVQTAKDISGSEFPHDGVQTSAAARPTYDKVTKILNFDGTDDFFEIANATDINTGTTSERTFAMVFRTGSDVTSRQMIYEEGGGVRGINVYIRNGSLYLGFWNLNNDGDGAQPFVSTNTPIQANTNYYVTMVFDYSNYTGPSGPNGTLRGTINGTAFAFSGQSTSRLYSHPGLIGLGAMNNGTCYDDSCPGGNGDYFGGDIFEFVMYNAAISSALELEYFNYLVEKWPDPFPVTGLNLSSQYTNSSSSSPQINWTASVSTDIDHYKVAIGTTPGGEEEAVYQNVGNVTSTTISGLSLTECTDYFASVKAVDPEPSESTVETSEFFKYDGTNPSDPGAIVLSGGASTTDSKNFSWTSSSDNCAFSGYEVSLGTTAGSQDVVAWTNIGNILTYQFTGLSLTGGTDYFVNVRGVDAAGNFSNSVSSTAWQVDTCVATDTTNPTDPSGLGLSGNAGSNSSPSLSWGASTDSCGLSHYEVAIGTTAGASNTVAFTNVGDVLTYKFFSIVPPLQTNTDYFLSVKAVDLAGNESNVVSSVAWNLPAPGSVSSGLVLWLDGDDISTLFQSTDCSSTAVSADGQAVGCWKDKSTSGFNATATAGARPIYETNEFNGKSVIRFDGNDDALDFTNINNIRTVFIVNKSSAATYQPFLGDNTSTNWFTNDTALIGSGGSSFLTAGAWRVNKVDVVNPQTTTQSGQYSLYSVVSTGNVEADHIASDRKIGGRFFGGDYVELIVYNRALSASEVTAVENYLYDKWFSAAPGPLAGLSLDSNYTTNSSVTPTLTWTHSGATDFSYYEAGLGQTAGTNDAAGFYNIGGNNSYQFTGTTLAECTDYFISVRAVDTSGLKGDLSSSVAFKYDGTNPSPVSTPILSGTASTSTSEVVTWASSTDNCEVGGYEVALGSTAGGNDVVNWTDVGNVNSHQFTGLSLSSATDYFLSVRTKDAAGNVSAGTSSAAFQVTSCVATDTTSPTAPGTVNLSGTAELRSTPQASWGTGTDACAFSHHEISIGTSTSTDDVVSWANIGTNTVYQYSNLPSNLSFDTNYYINVRSVDLAGNISSITSSNAFQLKGPASVSATGLALWIDVDKDGTIFAEDTCSTAVTTNNTQVGCIKDLSGNDNNLTVNATANKPVFKTNSFNGKQALYFDGATNEYLDFDSTISNIRTVFWVLKEDSSNLGDTAFLLGDPNGSTNDFHRGATGGAIFSGANAAAVVRNGTLQINKVVNDGTITNLPLVESVISLVTTGNATAGAFSRDRVSCCGQRTFGGNLAELIIYDRALNSTEVGLVEDYLMTKWNLVNTSTEWTGAISSDWFNGGNWSNGVPTSSLDCVIPDKVNDPIIASGRGICRDITITTGNLTLQNGTSAELEVFDDFVIQGGSLTVNDGQIIMSDDGSTTTFSDLDLNGATGVNLTFNRTAGGIIYLASDASFDSFVMPTGSNFEFKLQLNSDMTAPNGITINGGVFHMRGYTSLRIGDGQAVTLNGGTFKTSGLNDTLGTTGQNLANKALLTNNGTGRWAFNASSGIVDLTGFLIDNIDSNGLYIGGTTNLLTFDGGQFTNLPKDYSTPAKGLHLDTSAAISESIAVNVGFNWGAANTGYAGDPLPSDNYYTVYANNCGGGTLIFDQWFGDFWGSPTAFDTEGKIYDNADGGNCSVTMDIAVSPVTITSFSATGYNQSILVEWETGSELDHLGFNIYRSTNPIEGFTQINNELIRNYLTSGEFRGRYRFVDPDLTNDTIYYYVIEDVAINGDRETHGPVFAMPKASLGAVPAPGDSDINTPITDPGSLDLGNGVSLLSQSNSSFRISVNPASLALSTSDWNSSYVEVGIPGYSKFSTEGAPEVLTRRILVPVDGAYTNVQGTIFSQTYSTISGVLSGKKIQPAPSFIDNGSGQLSPSYNPDPTYYNSASDFPTNYYSLNPSTVEILGKHYVELVINPLQYEALNNNLERMDQLILDVGLDGPAWDFSPPSDIYQVSPSVSDGVIRLKYSESGIYKLTYDELSDENIEGPLAGKDTATFRAFYHGQEIPLRVDSTSGYFSSGDSIVLYAPYEVSLDDHYEEIVISTFDFYVEDGVSDDPLRIESLVPTNNSFSSLDETNLETHLENENNYAVFDVPIGMEHDHLFLKRLYTLGTGVITANSRYSFTVDMSQLNGNSESVRVEVVVSNRGVLSENPDHHLKLTINGVDYDSTVFRTNVPVSLTYEVPTSYFVSGNNTVLLTVLGDQIDSNDYDMLDLESVKVTYERNNLRLGTQTLFSGGEAGAKFTAWNFPTSDVQVFDVSTTRNVFQYGQIFTDTFDGGSTYQVSFKNLYGSFGEGGSKKIVVEDNNFKSFDSVLLGRGVDTLLKDSSNEYQHIIITDSPGLSAAQRLADYRTGEGTSSIAVTLDQLYGEFSHGRKDAYAINRFINYARENWTTPPKYILIMSDSSYDPKDDLAWAGEFLHPVLLYRGSQNDFGSDPAHGLTGLGTDEESLNPVVAIGRLPTNNPFLLESYVEKVIAYESGSRAPSAKAKSSIFVIGEADENENFKTPSESLAGTLIAANREFGAAFIDRNNLADDTEANSEVTNAFGEGTLFLTYMGHGAEDLWGLGGFFEATDAETLTNTELPIVMGLGCLNSYYYDADTEWYSLAEKLVLNPDGGAIAFWGSTTVTSPQAQLKLATNAFNEFGQRSKTYQTNARIGEIMLAAQSAMGRNILERDMSMSWTLFGDPALRLPEAAFSEPAPAPSSAAPRPPAPVPEVYEKGGLLGCSLAASTGSSPATAWDFLLFLLEIFSYFGIYRVGRKKFKSKR